MDGAADADGLVLGQRSCEEVAPLTGASSMAGGVLDVHAPQCTSQTGAAGTAFSWRPWTKAYDVSGEAASTWFVSLVGRHAHSEMVLVDEFRLKSSGRNRTR
jgi:hypothetical protein